MRTVLRPSPLEECAAAWGVLRSLPEPHGELRYRDAGDGPALVLVHGLGVSAGYWSGNGPALAAAGLRVIAPDLPGFGHSGGRPAITIEEQAAALLLWADALGLPDAVYVGHSLSCQSVLELAASHPTRVRGLILEGPSGAEGPRFRHQAFGLFRDAFREPVRLLPYVAEAYLRAGIPRVVRTWLNGGAHNPLEIVSRVAVPGILIVGRRDPIVPPGFAEALAAGLGGRPVIWMKGAAHAAHYSAPEAFNRVVLEFLESLGS